MADNRNLGPEDFTTYTLFVPEGPEFPNGGGYELTRLRDRNPDTRGRPLDRVTTDANSFGGRSQTWKGIDVTLDARLSDLTLRGGLSTGSTSFDRCALLAAVPEATGGAGEFCKTSTNWLTQVKLLGAYTFPYDIQLAGTLRSIAGPQRSAAWLYDASATDLGRPLFNGSRRTNILEPGTTYGDRSNVFDLRLTKLLSIGRQARVRAMVDLYNLFNTNTATFEDNRIEQDFAPVVIVSGRLAKFGLQFDF